MSRYLYTLHDYHAIKKASIPIEGITVLAGINGSGKSTLSKWLYYIVNGASNFDTYLYRNFASEVINILRHYDQLHRDINVSPATQTRLQNSHFFREALSKAQQYIYDEAEIDNLEDIYQKTLQRFSVMLSVYLNLSKGNINSRKERLLSYIGIDESLYNTIDELVSAFIKTENTEIEELKRKYLLEKENREQKKFYDIIRHRYTILEETPNNINLEEDGVKLFRKEKVGNLFNLSYAIYIDTPLATSGNNGTMNNVFWWDLRRKMDNPQKGYEASLEVRKLSQRIKNIIHGKVILKKNDFEENELHFLREDGLEIKIEDAATGMKSFSYILRLLENGYLDDKTLLMIDEPEAHLHPQWIIEFARILVLLQKELKVKILIDSHNPDMVAALQSIASKENVIDNLHFYLAKPIKEGAFNYEFVEQGKSIEGIFESFNMAYQKIKQYGDSSL